LIAHPGLRARLVFSINRHTGKSTPETGGAALKAGWNHGGWCVTLQETETITVMIPRAAPGNWYQMNACLRGPNLTQQESKISSMLKSVRIAKGD
jgi:hypothetical protein